jgi:hypothetical protein
MLEDNTNNAEKVTTLLTYRGRLNGKEGLNIYNYPESVPDPHIKTVVGKFMYGFILDGHGGGSDSFEDPETHEKGVNDQLWRAVGCFKDYDLSLPNRPFLEGVWWDTTVDFMPAWSITITGDDLSKNGPVTVTFDKALRHLKRNATGGILPNATYALDPNPRSHNVFRGEIKNHVLTIEPSNLRLESEPPMWTEISLRNAHMRLNLEQSGDLNGFVGGYQKWLDWFFLFGAAGMDCSVADIPGLYYALKRFADADPDPATGQNTSISATFRIEAVPAFLVRTDGKVVATPAGVVGAPAMVLARPVGRTE